MNCPVVFYADSFGTLAQSSKFESTVVAGSHAIYLSQPAAVAALIEQVATAVAAQFAYANGLRRSEMLDVNLELPAAHGRIRDAFSRPSEACRDVRTAQLWELGQELLANSQNVIMESGHWMRRRA